MEEMVVALGNPWEKWDYVKKTAATGETGWRKAEKKVAKGGMVRERDLKRTTWRNPQEATCGLSHRALKQGAEEDVWAVVCCLLLQVMDSNHDSLSCRGKATYMNNFPDLVLIGVPCTVYVVGKRLELFLGSSKFEARRRFRCVSKGFSENSATDEIIFKDQILQRRTAAGRRGFHGSRRFRGNRSRIRLFLGVTEWAVDHQPFSLSTTLDLSLTSTVERSTQSFYLGRRFGDRWQMSIVIWSRQQCSCMPSGDAIKKQQARLGRALHCLSQKLYS